MKNIIGIALLTLVVTACGSTKEQPHFASQEPVKKPKVEKQTKFERLWRINLGSSISEGEAEISAGLLGDKLFAASVNGRIYKIDSATGKADWSVKTKMRISAGVGIGNGIVAIGTDKGEVVAYRQDSGEESWRTQLASEILASPVIGDGIVVARSIDGKVYGLSAINGDIIWTISRQMPRLTLRGDSNPVIVQNIVFVGFSDGTFAALDVQNGRALWDLPISFAQGSSEIERLADIDTTPLFVGNRVYVSSYQEVTHALDLQRRQIDWSVDLSSFQPMSFDAAFLYLVDKQGVIHQINRTTGELSWSQDGLKFWPLGGPIVQGGYLVIPDGDGAIYVIDKITGRFVGRHSLSAKRVVGTPIVDSGIVYVTDSDGALQAFRIVAKQ